MSTCNEMPKYDLVTKAIKPNIEEEKSLDFGKGHIKIVDGNLEYDDTYSIKNFPELAPLPHSQVFYGKTVSTLPNAGYNSTVNYYNFSNAFTGFNRQPKKTTMEFGAPIEDTTNNLNQEMNIDDIDFKKFKTEETFSLNTLQEFDKNLENIKRENEDAKKLVKNIDKNKKYISQDEIENQKNKIFGCVDESHNYVMYLENIKYNTFKKLLELLAEKGIHFFKVVATSPEELEIQINEWIKKEKIEMAKREKLMEGYSLKNYKSKGIYRKGYNNGRLIDEKDARFIKKYARYLLFKKIKDAGIGIEDDDNERLYSQDIFNNNSQIADTQNVTSFVAFAKLIFAILNKDKSGFIKKDDIAEISIDERILQDLGFQNQEEFMNYLTDSVIDEKNISEMDFCKFLLGKTGIWDEYLNLPKNNTEKDYTVSKPKKKYYDENVVEISDNEDSDFDLPGLRTHLLDFLELPYDYQKLDALISLEDKLYNPKNIKSKNKKIPLDLSNKIIYISYHEYLTFLRRFHTKNQINFTIPEPFDFLRKDYQKKKLEKIKEILEERVREENYYRNYQFRANELKPGIWGNRFQNIIEYEREQRQLRTDKLKEKIIAEMKPFSFYEKDERNYKEKIKQEPIPPTYPPFRAGAIKWLSQVLIYEDMIRQEKEERKIRRRERMEKIMLSSKLPPRMQMAEEERIKKEKMKKVIEHRKFLEDKKRRQFKAKEVPPFKELQEEFENMLNEKKRAAKLTTPEPFTFHEPKKKVAILCKFLDVENDPTAKNPKKKTDIKKVIKKMQRKPKIEPKSTHTLDLLMDKRRKEIEEKQRQIEEKEREDILREEKQAKLKDRVLNSKAIVDNTRELNERRMRIQEEFKDNLQKLKESYDAELTRRIQRVYNRPLLVEQVGNKGEKFSLNKNYQEDLDDILLDPIAGEEEYEQENGDDEEGYEDEENGEGAKNGNGGIDEEKNEDDNENGENENGENEGRDNEAVEEEEE